MRIGLLSDTHSYLDQDTLDYLEDCDEIWHAGDVGSHTVLDRLEELNKPLRAVYGNIDDPTIQRRLAEDLHFTVEDVPVFITHIGGYPGRYTKRVRRLLDELRPRLYICGHSHILKIMPDPKRDLLHINPGACGQQGFHSVRTIVRFQLDAGRIGDLEVIELGRRGQIRPSEN
jgi:putative phosphoesterase